MTLGNDREGRPEAAAGIVYLLVVVAGPVVSGQAPEWELVLAGLFLIWAIVIAPSSGIRSTGLVGCVTAGLFYGGVETAALTAALAFLVVEVQVLVGRWWASGATGIIVLFWFGVGDPLSAWNVSWLGQVLLAGVGVAVAAVVGMTRRLLQAERRERATAMELERMAREMKLARKLHDGLADSLTRVVLISGYPGEESPRLERINGEARNAIASLRAIIGDLRSDDGGSRVLVSLGEELHRGVESLGMIGLAPRVDSPDISAILVDSRLADSLREVFTNVLKHGTDPVRVTTEVADGQARVFVVNSILGSPRQDVTGSGMGLRSIVESVRQVGGNVDVDDSGGLMRVLLEMPVVEGRADR